MLTEQAIQIQYKYTKQNTDNNMHNTYTKLSMAVRPHARLKIMILQEVVHPISCLGVCYANDPQKGVWRPHLRLI